MAAIDICYLFMITFSNFRDRDYMRMEMMHLAHMLEKILQNPDKVKRFQKRGKVHLRRLKSLICKWDKEVSELSNDINWVKQIYQEYTLYIKTGHGCKLLGKVETKLRGLREIQQSNKTNSQIAEIDLLEFMKGRRSIRNWSNEHVTKEYVNLLVEAASWAPSSCNRQTNRYIVIRNKRKIETISATVKGGRSFFNKAPILIVIVNDIRRYQFPDEKYTPYQDSAAAVQNMLLMAHRIGLAACWASYASDTLLILRERKVRKLLKIPYYYKISGIVAIGKPKMRVCLIPRFDREIILFGDELDG